MTLVSIVPWCSLKTISHAAEMAVEGTKNCLKMETSQPWHSGAVQELCFGTGLLARGGGQPRAQPRAGSREDFPCSLAGL